MDDLDAPAHNDLKHKLRHLLKLRYLMPFIYSLFCYLYWKESSSCYGRIFIINSVIVLFFCFSPTLLLQFDYLTVILFFLWVFKNDNSEAVRETDVACLDTQNNIFFMLSLWIFKIAIWLLTTFMVIIVIFLLLSLVREFLLPPAYQGPGLSEETINNLPLVRYSEYKADPTPDKKHKKEDVCPICLEAFESEDELRLIPNCSHVYHIDCIKTWLSANTICPYCRGEIPHKEQGFRATHRSTYTASILVHLQEMSLLSDRDAGNPTQPLLPNRR